MAVPETVLARHGIAQVPEPAGGQPTPAVAMAPSQDGRAAARTAAAAPAGAAAEAGAGVVGARPLPAGAGFPKAKVPATVAAIGTVGAPAGPLLATAAAAVVPAVAGPEVDVVGAAAATPARRLMPGLPPAASSTGPATRPIAATTVRHEAAAAVPGPPAAAMAVRPEVQTAVVASGATVAPDGPVRHVRDGAVPEVPAVRPGAGEATLREDEVPGDKGPATGVASVRPRPSAAPGAREGAAIATVARGLIAAGRAKVPDMAEAVGPARLLVREAGLVAAPELP